MRPRCEVLDTDHLGVADHALRDRSTERSKVRPQHIAPPDVVDPVKEIVSVYEDGNSFASSRIQCRIGLPLLAACSSRHRPS